jgi:hypothetical protein
MIHAHRHTNMMVPRAHIFLQKVTAFLYGNQKIAPFQCCEPSRSLPDEDTFERLDIISLNDRRGNLKSYIIILTTYQKIRIKRVICPFFHQAYL